VPISGHCEAGELRARCGIVTLDRKRFQLAKALRLDLMLVSRHHGALVGKVEPKLCQAIPGCALLCIGGRACGAETFNGLVDRGRTHRGLT